MAISKEIINSIIELRTKGISINKISKELLIGVKTVSKYANKYNIGGDLSSYGTGVCCYCKNKFDKKTEIQEYCKSECRKKHYTIKNKKNTKKYYENYKKKNNISIISICLNCNDKFETTNKSKKYCSNICCNKYKKEKEKDARKETRKKECKYCNKEFIDESNFNTELYCSKECHKLWMNKNPRHSKICNYCNKEYLTNWKAQKHCSRECSNKAMSVTDNRCICICCNKEYTKQSQHAGKFCSRKCYAKYTGVNEIINYKYKIHLTDASSIKRAKYYKVYYEKVDPIEIYERDNWICGICGEKIDKKLSYPDKMSATLDHIKPLSKGGTHEKNNIQSSHGKCNFSKGNKY